jgi:hypothetical protein
LQTVFKNARATQDPRRREAWVLAQLQSVYAWRGSLVDQLIERYVIPGLNVGHAPGRDALLREARARFDRQVEFAQAHRVREPGMSKVKGGDAFAAFMDREYGIPVTQEVLDGAWADVERAIDTLYKSFQDLRALIRAASSRIAGRPLQFDFAGVRVLAVPDLLLFFRAAPPVIVDWKVHTSGTHDARPQLATYALALGNAKPHRDFPPSWNQWEAGDLRLIEAQLLVDRSREYRIDDEDLTGVEDTIARSAWAMRATLGEGTPPDPFDLPHAHFGEACARCPFRGLCWRPPDEAA